jgi:hypothetical protein
MNSHAPLLSRDPYSDVVANAFMLREILEAVNCHTRHPHHGGSSDQHQKRLERGFARFCYNHPLIVRGGPTFTALRTQHRLVLVTLVAKGRCSSPAVGEAL